MTASMEPSAARFVQRLLHALAEGVAVRKVGKAVVARHVGDARLRAPLRSVTSSKVATQPPSAIRRCATAITRPSFCSVSNVDGWSRRMFRAISAASSGTMSWSEA